MKATIYLFSILFLSDILFAQKDSSVFVVPEMKIYQKEKGNDVVYEFDKGSNLIYLYNDSLSVSPQQYKFNVNLNSVDKIAFKSGSYFWGAATVGAITGGVLGFFAGGFLEIAANPGGSTEGDKNRPVEFHPLGAIMGTVVIGAVLGGVFGLVGLITPYYDNYELNKVTPGQKQAYLLKVLKKFRHNKNK